jgi:hypothetical protein
MGRAPALYDSDIDVDLPLEVDDEYWIHSDPTQSFKQPPDVPSRTTAFVHLTRLCGILAYALQILVRLVHHIVGASADTEFSMHPIKLRLEA